MLEFPHSSNSDIHESCPCGVVIVVEFFREYNGIVVASGLGVFGVGLKFFEELIELINNGGTGLCHFQVSNW